MCHGTTAVTYTTYTHTCTVYSHILHTTPYNVYTVYYTLSIRHAHAHIEYIYVIRYVADIHCTTVTEVYNK